MAKPKKTTSAYDAQEMQIAAQTNAFLEMLTRRGLLKDQEINNEKVQKARQEYLQKAFHNTELLLENYRMIRWVLACCPDEIASELDAPMGSIDELIEKMDIHICIGDKKAENRMRGTVKTRLLMDRVNDALTVLKMKPQNGKKLYDLIYVTFLQEESWTHSQIIEHLEISTRTYYRLRKEAVEVISTRLWATPNSALDSWFEVLALVEGMK